MNFYGDFAEILKEFLSDFQMDLSAWPDNKMLFQSLISVLTHLLRMSWNTAQIIVLGFEDWNLGSLELFLQKKHSNWCVPWLNYLQQTDGSIEWDLDQKRKMDDTLMEDLRAAISNNKTRLQDLIQVGQPGTYTMKVAHFMMQEIAVKSPNTLTGY
jgi:hypothetical protein